MTYLFLFTSMKALFLAVVLQFLAEAVPIGTPRITNDFSSYYRKKEAIVSVREVAKGTVAPEIEALYENGKKAYIDGRYLEAVSFFEDLLKESAGRYPSYENYSERFTSMAMARLGERLEQETVIEGIGPDDELYLLPQGVHNAPDLPYDGYLLGDEEVKSRRTGVEDVGVRLVRRS